MDALTIAAASGMKARIESLEMLANNIANQSTPGYKADREFYSLYISPEAEASPSDLPTPPLVPVIERQWTDFAQGTLTETGNPLNLALTGQGFFSIAGPNGPLYTRNGAFRLSLDGTLQTQDGYAVLDTGGNPIHLSPAQDVEISRTGEIHQGGVLAGQLALVDFAQPQDLVKRFGTYFQTADPSVRPQPAQGIVVQQGRLESANLAPAVSAVRLVDVMRQFEMLQKAIQIGADMSHRAEEVARVGT